MAFTLQKHQEYIRYFVGSDVIVNDSLFLFYSTGSGKTCAAVLASEYYVNYLRNRPQIDGYVYIIANKLSIDNFIWTIVGECGNIANNIPYDAQNIYITEQEMNILNEQRHKSNIMVYRKMKRDFIMNRLNEAGYRFYTFHAFGRNSIYDKIKSFDNSLVIIDEAHSLLHNNKFYISFNKIKEKSRRHRMILLSATPMINDPEDIVNFTNIMYKKAEQIDRTQLFQGSGKQITNEFREKEGKKILVEKYRGRISYFRSHDTENYPSRIDMGTIPKGLLKYTKIVRVPMTKYQMLAYEKYWNGNMTSEIKMILNFCLPNDTFVIANIKYNMTPKQIKDLGVRFVKKRIVSGPFLYLKNLRKWSNKFYRCISDIIRNKDGLSLVFSKYVRNTGIILFTEALRMNGFVEYGGEVTDHSRHYRTHETYLEWKQKGKDITTFIPAKYVLFYDVLSNIERENIIKIFNSPANVDGQLIKIFVGSQLIKESVNLYRIRYLYILEYQDNISRLEQIIGRATRYKGHIDVDPVVHIYRYVSSLRSIPERNNIWSAEELEYQKDENNHITIKYIERILKTIAIDCKANHDSLDPKKYNMTKECDYMGCRYRCIYDDYDYKDIYGKKDELIYEIFYRDIEISNLVAKIKLIFRNNVLYNHKSLIARLMPFTTDEKYIHMALDKMIMERTTLTNKYGVDGYLQFLSNHYLFYPEKLPSDLTLSINMRSQGSKYIPKVYISLNDMIYANITKRSMAIKGKQPTNIKKILKKISSLRNNISSHLKNLDPNIRTQLLERCIIEYRRSEKTIDRAIFNVLKFFKYYLIDKTSNDINSLLYNANYDEYFSQYKFSTHINISRGNSIPERNINKDMTKNFIGHILGNVPRIISSEDKFINRQFSDIIDIDSSIPENDYIVGILEKHPVTGFFIFKLRYIDSKQVFADKRRRKKGFKCSQINNKTKIMEIYHKLGGKPRKDGIVKISQYCKYIEDLIRQKQYENPDIRWLYDYYL